MAKQAPGAEQYLASSKRRGVVGIKNGRVVNQETTFVSGGDTLRLEERGEKSHTWKGNTVPFQQNYSYDTTTGLQRGEAQAGYRSAIC